MRIYRKRLKIRRILQHNQRETRVSGCQMPCNPRKALNEEAYFDLLRTELNQPFITSDEDQPIEDQQELRTKGSHQMKGDTECQLYIFILQVVQKMRPHRHFPEGQKLVVIMYRH